VNATTGEPGSTVRGESFMSEAGDRISTTIGLISTGRSSELEQLTSRLLRLYSRPGLEIVVAFEDPQATEPCERSGEHGVRWIELPARQGIACNRNRVIEAARGGVLVFLDDDCLPRDDWLDRLLEPLEDDSIDAVMGKVVVPPSGLLGDSIAALGYPAGGSTGYSKMFNVDEDGLTDNISTLNCAIRVETLRRFGGFDESMTQGGEDTELAWRMSGQGVKIAYWPAAVVSHPSRSSLRDFCRWFVRRGRAKYQFAARVPAIGGFVGRRIKSYGSILRQHGGEAKILLVVPLLASSVLLQQAGFLYELFASRGKRPEGKRT